MTKESEGIPVLEGLPDRALHEKAHDLQQQIQSTLDADTKLQMEGRLVGLLTQRRQVEEL
jgi:hypothetical protein